MFEEFKKFAMRGNVIDLAVGVVIGAAFTGIVNSLVKDIIMPPIGWAMGGIDFSNFFFTVKGGAFNTLADAQKAGAVTIQEIRIHLDTSDIGNHLQTVVSAQSEMTCEYPVISLTTREESSKEDHDVVGRELAVRARSTAENGNVGHGQPTEE